MTLTTKAPAPVTGYFKGDILRLNDFCRNFLQDVTIALKSIDAGNITSLSCDKLTEGTIKLNGAYITFSDTSDGVCIDISTSDGTQYIKIENGLMNIKCASISTDSITANSYINLPETT